MIGSAEVRKLAIKEICQISDEKYDEEKYYGILLCEGEMNSLDAKLYSKVYPALLVIPVGGWTDVTKLLRSIRKRNEGIEVFGLIDRDSNSKRKIKELRVNEGVYCTKLPFIENIICTPEIVKILCKHLDLDYRKTIKSINQILLSAIANKIKDAFPVNVGLTRDETIESVSVSIKKEDETTIEKTVNASSCLYAYRDKSVANIVAAGLYINGRQEYYNFIGKLLDDANIAPNIVKVARFYLPVIG